MLNEFIGEEKAGLEDDDDIYRQYQEMASRQGEMKDKRADWSSFKVDKDAMKPEVPRFDDYFRAEADGIHPFDRIADSFDQSELGSAEDAEAERQREHELYKRELLGRLIGQRLSPAQYELISGTHRNDELR